jgi:hypothetical protein
MRWWTAALLLLALTLSGQDKARQDLKKRAGELRGKLEQATDLKFKSEVGVGVYSKEELKGFLLKELATNLTKRKARAWEKIGYKFGFFPRDFDLVKSYVEMMTDSIAGFYHPRSKELKLVKDPGEAKPEEKQMERMLGVKMADVYLYHELFHSLQDQCYGGLNGLKSSDDRNDDRIMGVDSVIEGEACYMHFNYMFKEQYNLIKGMVGQEQADPPKPHYPRYLYKTLTFPYTIGFLFVDKCIQEKKWKTAATMFSDPPLSSEQVLHPDKYLKERDYPTLITMRFARINEAVGEGWKRLDDNVHGEYTIRLMFEEQDLRKRGPKAAAGWDGDRFTVYERPGDGRLLLIWATTWDDEDEAKEFQEAYLELLGKKYGVLTPQGGADGRSLYRTKDQGVVALERKGADLLIIEGTDDAPAAEKLLPEVWKNLKKEELREWKKPVMNYM